MAPASRRILTGGVVGIAWLLGFASALAANYAIEINGADKELTAKLNIISDLKKGLRDYPTVAALRRAARRDQKAFDAALTAAGFYLGRSSFEIERGEDGEDPKVTFTIDTGPAFKISEYEILYKDDYPGRPATLSDAGIKPNGSAAGAAIRDVQITFQNYLWDHGYPSAEIVGRRAIALPDQAIASAVLIYETGPRAKFGKIEIRGANRTREDFINKLKTWDDGADYERARIVSYRDRLGETGLFNAISVAPGPADENGQAPILVDLAERKRRTIGAGVSYSTSEGPGGRLFFENRNMFGRGESLRIEMRGSGIEQSLDFTARKPLPGLPGYAFANVGFSNETTDAFNARSLRLASGLSKKWLGDKLETRAALAFETSKVKQDGLEERTYFASTPLSIIWNSEDDLLEPTKGFKTSLTVTPYTGTETFTQIESNARSRLFLGSGKRITIAGRAASGATIGNQLFDLPANKRFFAGGGGSIRGFGFQEAGPLDTDDIPIGGRSYLTGAIEIRGKVTNNIQLAGFIDGGTVNATPFPNFDDRLFVGYGGGVRYFTPIGPIRVDVAFPVDKRPSDSGFQIYIALGQPF